MQAVPGLALAVDLICSIMLAAMTVFPELQYLALLARFKYEVLTQEYHVSTGNCGEGVDAASRGIEDHPESMASQLLSES